MRERTLRFKCHHCSEKFESTLDMSQHAQVIVCCPHCGAQCGANLNAYRQPISNILKGNPLGDSELTDLQIEPGTVILTQQV